MPTNIHINSITGATPFNIYLCYSSNTSCVYIDTIPSSSLPYDFLVPSILEGELSYNLKVIDNNGCVFYQNVVIGSQPFILKLTFDDIVNADILVGDSTNIADWNTFFDLPTNGNPFTTILIIGNEVNLIGGSEIILIDGLFVYYDHLIKVEDSGSVITIMGTFEECDGITEVSFNGCTQVFLGDASYGSFGYSTVVTANFPVCTYMESGFYDSNLVSIFAPLLEEAGNDCFASCNLTTIDLPSLITAGNSCFNSCDSLTTISLPSLIAAGNNCFNNCNSLTTISLSSLITAGYGCFTSIDSLTTVDLPQLTAAGDDCFNSCNSLTTISLPSLITAGYGCFNSCSLLTTINLPVVQSIGYGAFASTILTTINLSSCTDLGGTVGDDGVFDSIIGNTITLTIPAALMTCDGGNPDGDIQYLQANNTVTII